MRRLLGFVLAVIVTAAVSSMVQTLRVHAELAAMGAEVPFATRLSAIGHDLLGFAPTYAAIVAAGFLIAFAVAGLIRRYAQRVGPWLHAVAGGAAILTTLLLMQTVLGMSVIAGARGVLGIALFTLVGTLGGAVFARFGATRR
ncbi:hypothetical protein [Aquimonas sp.]|jgi:hypothetical protein|uniref:hypothetical protein n=1 Tax=Aquimonas sp. TaxID=1872588 RepID=UPI0037BE5E33